MAKTPKVSKKKIKDTKKASGNKNPFQKTGKASKKKGTI
jgi:hypothetical protein